MLDIIYNAYRKHNKKKINVDYNMFILHIVLHIEINYLNFFFTNT